MTSKLSNTAFFTNKEEILPPPLLQWAFARVTADMIEFGSYLLSPRVKREKNGVRLSLLWTDPVLCVSALAEHMLYYKTYQPVWGKASLCVPSLLSHRTTSGFSPSSVPRPLVKKKCGKLSKGTWSKLCVKTPKPVPGTHWSFSIPTPSSFLKFSRCPNFSPSLFLDTV